MKPGTILATKVRALKSPWFLMRANPGGEEVSIRVYAPNITDRLTYSWQTGAHYQNFLGPQKLKKNVISVDLSSG
jgi:hypothetical protein